MNLENEKWVREAIEVFRLRYYGFHQLDKDAAVLAAIPGTQFSNSNGKLKRTRQALQLSVRAAAQKMRIRPSAWSKFEEREAQGDITLRSLAQIAEALDCELVYGIRPKSKESFCLIAWKQLWPGVLRHRALKADYFFNIPEYRRTLIVATIAGVMFTKARDRREQGWSQRSMLEKEPPPTVTESVGL